jgi:hypothetical protein
MAGQSDTGSPRTRRCRGRKIASTPRWARSTVVEMGDKADNADSAIAQEPIADAQQLEMRAREQQAVAHETGATDAVQVYLDGFNMLIRGLDALRHYNFAEAAEQRVIMALFVKSINSFRCFTNSQHVDTTFRL